MPRVSNAGKLSFPLQMVVAITVASVGIAGTQWASTYGLRSDVRDIKTQMEAASKLQEERGSTLRAAQEAEARLQAERSAAIRDAIADMRRRQELQQYEIQGLKEAILKLQPSDQGGRR